MFLWLKELAVLRRRLLELEGIMSASLGLPLTTAPELPGVVVDCGGLWRAMVGGGGCCPDMVQIVVCFLILSPGYPLKPRAR